jgi:hypothetical protein
MPDGIPTQFQKTEYTCGGAHIGVVLKTGRKSGYCICYNLQIIPYPLPDRIEIPFPGGIQRGAYSDVVE